MYQSPGALDFNAAYQQNETVRFLAQRQLEREVDHHSPDHHRFVAMAVALLLVLVVVIAL